MCQIMFISLKSSDLQLFQPQRWATIPVKVVEDALTGVCRLLKISRSNQLSGWLDLFLLKKPIHINIPEFFLNAL